MVKALFLGLLAATMCGFARAAPAPQPGRRQRPEAAPLEDAAARSERSTNLSHVTGAARKIQMFIKNRHLQLLPDGTVNGTTDDTSAYTILQRTTVGIGQMKIQGVATCQYLCMDSCGLLYGSREFGDECVFNETIEQHHYNTYSSSKYSNDRRTLYLALNRRGQPRKVLLRGRQQLGRLSSYTRVLTRTVAAERAEELHPVRHHAHLCSQPEGRLGPAAVPAAAAGPPRCRKRKKRKKKKRKCPPDGGGGGGAEGDGAACLHARKQTNNHRKLPNRLIVVKNKCDSEDSSDECQRDVNVVVVSKRKKTASSTSDPLKKKRPSPKKGGRKRHQPPPITSTEPPATSPEDATADEDYGTDPTTHWEWDDSTPVPEPPMAISGAPFPLQPD